MIDNHKLSESKEGLSWISQFNSPEDKKTAKTLLDNIKFVDDSELKTSIQNLVNEFKLNNEVTCLLVAREPDDTLDYWLDDKLQTPLKVNTEDIGSEGYFCKLARDLCKGNTLLDHPSLNKMKETNCRHILILDDIGGSGNRITKFVDWITRNKTIRSWMSLKLIDINICVYAITKEAQEVLKRNSKIKTLIAAQFVDKNTFISDDSECEKIKALCINYGNIVNPRMKEYYLGYGNAFSLLVFDYGCPNNVPYILWGDSYPKNKWQPLFTNKNNTLNLNTVTNTVVSPLKKEIKHEKELKSLLFLLSKKSYNIEYYSSYMHVNIFLIKNWLQKLLELQWIDSVYKVTPQGRNILRQVKKEEKDSEQLVDIDAIYYLKSK